MTTRIHEVWIDSDGMPGLCLAGPMGDGFRAPEGEGSKLAATIEASCRFEIGAPAVLASLDYRASF